MTFQNNPGMRDDQNANQTRQIRHQSITFDHYGTHVTIKENGHVVISTGMTTTSDGTEEFDEVEVPAALIFKIVNALKLTRQVSYSKTDE